MYVVKTKVLISCAVLNCAADLRLSFRIYAKKRFPLEWLIFSLREDGQLLNC